jgi:hypothetical protein
VSYFLVGVVTGSDGSSTGSDGSGSGSKCSVYFNFFVFNFTFFPDWADLPVLFEPDPCMHNATLDPDPGTDQEQNCIGFFL